MDAGAAARGCIAKLRPRFNGLTKNRKAAGGAGGPLLSRLTAVEEKMRSARVPKPSIRQGNFLR
jgi:hypothetical protein